MKISSGKFPFFVIMQIWSSPSEYQHKTGSFERQSNCANCAISIHLPIRVFISSRQEFHQTFIADIYDFIFYDNRLSY